MTLPYIGLTLSHVKGTTKFESFYFAFKNKLSKELAYFSEGETEISSKENLKNMKIKLEIFFGNHWYTVK